MRSRGGLSATPRTASQPEYSSLRAGRSHGGGRAGSALRAPSARRAAPQGAGQRPAQVRLGRGQGGGHGGPGPHLPTRGMGSAHRRRYCEKITSAAIIGRPSCAAGRRRVTGPALCMCVCLCARACAAPRCHRRACRHAGHAAVWASARAPRPTERILCHARARFAW